MAVFAVGTPLTVSVTIANPRRVMLILVSGGAHVDFRDKEGLTPMHKAAQKGNYEAIKVC